jgi:hypothetical protein
LAIGYHKRSAELSATDCANNEFVLEDIEDRWIGGGEKNEVKLLSRAVFTVKQTNPERIISADTVVGTLPGEGGQ